MKWLLLILTILGLYGTAFIAYNGISEDPRIMDFAIFLFVLTLTIAFGCIAVYLAIKDWQDKLALEVDGSIKKASADIIEKASTKAEEVKRIRDEVEELKESLKVDIAKAVEDLKREVVNEVKEDNEKTRRHVIIHRDSFENTVRTYLHEWFNGVHNGGFFDDLDTLFENVNRILASKGEQPLKRATFTVKQSREQRTRQSTLLKEPLPPVPDHMVRVRREPTESGQDHRLISKEKYEANPGMYELYDTPEENDPSS